MDRLPWESDDADEPSGYQPPEDESWRGDVHLGPWPENLAGPEYWLYKKEMTNEDGFPLPPPPDDQTEDD